MQKKSHALGCVGMRCHSPYYWILLEHIGTTCNLYDPRILLDVPSPHTWNVWLHWCVGTIPFHTIYSHALGCVGMCCHSPHNWKLLEPPGTYTIYDPRILLDVPSPHTWNVWLHWCIGTPPVIQYIHMLWGVFACVAILPTTGYYWNILEPPGTYTTLKEPSWILLDVPCPQYLKCIAALMCSYPLPFI